MTHRLDGLGEEDADTILYFGEAALALPPEMRPRRQHSTIRNSGGFCADGEMARLEREHIDDIDRAGSAVLKFVWQVSEL